MSKKRYNGLVSFSGVSEYLNEKASVMDILVGAGVGLVGAAAIKAALKKFAPDIYGKIAASAGKFVPVLTGVGAAAALYFVQKNSNKSRAIGHAAGALTAGVVLSAMDFLREKPILGLDFSGSPVALDLSQYNGLLINDGSDGSQFNGLLINDGSDARMGDLVAMSMGEDGNDYSDMAALNAFQG